jgi:hypothetical protein
MSSQEHRKVMTRSAVHPTMFIQGLALTLLCFTSSGAPRWSYLGEANVDGRADHDRISVGESKGAFRRIQILVENSAVVFDRIVVHYGNGTQYAVPVAMRIPAGGKTREIDLPGDRRWIDSVEVWYQRGNRANGGKPKIRLMGIRW